jgi:hypothetical protein
MTYVLVYPLFLAAGILAVTERSPNVPGSIGIIALGSIGLTCSALVAAWAMRSHLARLLIVVGAFLVGGAITYAVSTLPEDFGWMTVIAVWLLTVTILTDIALAGDFFWKPITNAVQYLGKEDKDGKGATSRAVVERAVVRALTPVLLIVAIIGATLVAAHTPHPPSIAFGKHVVFTGLLTLLFFYGTLLILLPLARGVIAGELPVELTTSGPRFQEHDLALSKSAATELDNRLKASDAELQRLIQKSAGEAKAGISSLTTRVATSEEKMKATTRATAQAASAGILDLEQRIENIEKKLGL